MRERLIPGERSISEVLTDIVRNIQDIVRFEIRLAESEVLGQFKGARTSGILILTGIIAGAMSVLFLLLGVFAVLSRVLVPWAAAGCIGLGLALVALVTASLGARRLRRVPAPAKALANVKANVKEDVEWAKHAMK